MAHRPKDPPPTRAALPLTKTERALFKAAVAPLRGEQLWMTLAHIVQCKLEHYDAEDYPHEDLKTRIEQQLRAKRAYDKARDIATKSLNAAFDYHLRTEELARLERTNAAPNPLVIAEHAFAIRLCAELEEARELIGRATDSHLWPGQRRRYPPLAKSGST